MTRPKKGRFHPMHPEKYLGDATKIIYRSFLEARTFLDLDHDPNVVGWSSEEIIIWYTSPIDGRNHRYFPDLLVKKKKGDLIETTLIEIKPFSQVREPIRGKKRNKTFFGEVTTYGVNQAKWKAAESFCKRRGWKWKILTEKEIRAL